MIHFTKMQGAGNDFIILDNRDGRLSRFSFPALAASLCQRKLSLGADGLMVIQPAADGCDFSMDFYNADGSVGEMCGNGARCLTRYGLTHGLCAEPGSVRISTAAGIVNGYAAAAGAYTVRLNDPRVYVPHLVLKVQEADWNCAYMELGYPGLPHLILPLPDDMTQGQPQLLQLAKALRSHPNLPKGANVNFYRLLDDHVVTLYTFERGVEDFTLACGTGAGCTAAHLAASGLVSPQEVSIHTAGGVLRISMTLSCPIHANTFDTSCHTHKTVTQLSCSGNPNMLPPSALDCNVAHSTATDIVPLPLPVSSITPQIQGLLLTGPALFVAEGEISMDMLSGISPDC